jgi:hypothetical protein
VPFAGARAHHFAGAGDFKSLGHRLLRLNAFGSSHNYLIKRTSILGPLALRRKPFFGLFFAHCPLPRAGASHLCRDFYFTENPEEAEQAPGSFGLKHSNVHQ